MDMTLFTALLLFAFVASATPGPNNLMLLASGANFGLRRSLPHMFGISIGHSFMVFIVGLGLGEIFEASPSARYILTLLSIAYMLWLAWKIANSAAPGDRKSTASPFTFLQAAAFQWVNPKAYLMAIGAQANYAQGEGWHAALWVGIGFLMVNFPAISIWAWMGQKIRLWLVNPTRLRLFNWSMATLLVASLLPILFH